MKCERSQALGVLLERLQNASYALDGAAEMRRNENPVNWYQCALNQVTDMLE